MAFIFGWLVQHGDLALFTLLMLGMVGVPVPDEPLLTYAGYLVFQQRLALVPTLVAAFLGSVCGITLSYALGRLSGGSLARRIGRVLPCEPRKLDAARAWFRRHGTYALLFGYFIPGVRHLTAYVAGSSRVPLTSFALFAYAGGLLWSSSFIMLGYGLGDEWARTSVALHRWLVIGASVVFIALALLMALVWRRPRDG